MQVKSVNSTSTRLTKTNFKKLCSYLFMLVMFVIALLSAEKHILLCYNQLKMHSAGALFQKKKLFPSQTMDIVSVPHHSVCRRSAILKSQE